MTEIEILTKQTKNAYVWMHRMIDAVPVNKWDEVPKVVESNVTWQIGHQLLAMYYHSIMVITGHQEDILENLPMREYTKLFTFGTDPKNTVGKTNPEKLLNHLRVVEKKSMGIIKSLSVEDLEKALEPTKMPHPIAKTKFEALDWNIKHTMWHCGQIAMIKRIVDKAYDYGLKRP